MRVIYLRVTDELHDRLTTAADGRSLNSFVTAVLEGERSLTSPPLPSVDLDLTKVPVEATYLVTDKSTTPVESGLNHIDHPNFRRFCGEPGCPYA